VHIEENTVYFKAYMVSLYLKHTNLVFLQAVRFKINFYSVYYTAFFLKSTANIYAYCIHFPLKIGL